MQRKIAGAWAGCLIVISSAARAQCFDWDERFEPAGANGPVRSQVVFDDGTGPALYVGGEFTSVGDAQASCVAKWDGTHWSPLGLGLGGTDPAVLALAAFDDGSGPALYVGGRFTAAGGAPAFNIAKWDGANWSPLGAGVGGPFGQTPEVRTFATYDDGVSTALYVGGDFYFAGPLSVKHVARWDGAQWSSVGAGVGASGIVHALRVFDDGSGPRLYAGGNFAQINGASIPHVGAWNGTSWSIVDASFVDNVRALAVHDDGTGPALYVAEWSNYRVRKWNGTTSTVVGGAEVGAQPTSLASYDDGIHGPRLFVGSMFNGPFLQAWDGVAWSEPVPANPIGGAVRTLGTFDLGGGERLFIGGGFEAAGSMHVERAVAYDGTSFTTVHPASSVSRRVNALASYDGGAGAELFAAGPFFAAGSGQVTTLGAWNGTTWSGGDMAIELPLPPSGAMNALATWNDGAGEKLYAGGTQVKINGGLAVNGIASWNGSQWSALGNGLGTLSGTRASTLAVADDGSGEALYVGGLFFQNYGAPSDYLARWSGASWVPLAQPYPGIEPSAIASFVSPSGPRVVVSVAVFGPGVTWTHQWNGATWSTLGAGTNGPVNALAAFDDGSGEAIYAGGSFTTAGGLPAANIARWNGSQWSALGSGVSGRVYALRVFDDGSGPALYVGGQFTSAGGTFANNVARWDGAQWTALGTGVDGLVDAFAVHDDGAGPALYLGGDFGSSGNVIAHFIAKWSRSCTCGPVVYCTSGTTSNGCVPSISGIGSPSASAPSGFTISIANVEGQKQGHVFYGLSGPHAAPWGSSSHYLCVKAPTQRTGTQDSGGNAGACNGSIALDWNNYVATHAGALGVPFSAGQSVWAQLYFRDPPGPKTTALSNGLMFTLCP